MNRENIFISLVFDDENQNEITTGAVVTLDVHLHRENMSNLFSKQINGTTNGNDINDEQIAEQENQEKVLKYFFVSLFYY